MSTRSAIKGTTRRLALDQKILKCFTIALHSWLASFEDLIQEKPDHRLVAFPRPLIWGGNQRLRADSTELQNIHRQEIDAGHCGRS